MNKISLLLCSTIMSITLVGCGGGDDSKQVSDSTTSAKNTPVTNTKTAKDTSKTPAVSADEAFSNKLNTYVECYNSLSSNLNGTINRYASWVKNMDTGPTGKESIVYGLYDVNAKYVTDCKSKIEAVATSDSELDKTALSFVNIANNLTKVVNTLYPYYDQKDYKDDGFKKGKEMHADLANNAKEFVFTADKFASLLDIENDKQQAKQLVEVEKKEGKSVSYYRLSILIEAKKLYQLLEQDKFSVEEASKQLEQYTNIVNEADAYKKDPANEATMKKYGLMASSNLDSLISAAQDFNKSAKERFRSIRDNKPINVSHPSIARMTEGTIQNLQIKYNSLVSSFNRFR